MRLQPGQHREQFSYAIADPLVALSSVCAAAYFTEVVVMECTLGDPPQAPAKSVEAMNRIREIVEGGPDACDCGPLNPGYLRPLFLCAIESAQKDDINGSGSYRKDRESLV
jgi:hypothetical protein